MSLRTDNSAEFTPPKAGSLQERVYALVRRIPRGRVTTYRAIARALGNPGLARAVGNALNKNTDFKNIPCHRVVRTDGSTGGYVLGGQAKIRRLSAEGISMQKGRVRDLAGRLYTFTR